MRKFLDAIRFMTMIPVPGPEYTDLAEAGKASGFFPLVGLIIGLLLAAFARLCLLFLPLPVTAAAVTVLWILLTAGLHIDGLADLSDGLGGGWDVESRLRIMKDSSIGTYGALAIIILLMMKAVLIHAAASDEDAGYLNRLLIFAPAAGRCMQVLSIRIFPSAKKEGFGAVFKSGVSNGGLAAALIITVLTGTALLGWYGLILLSTLILFTLVAGRWISRRLGGLNGDSYGALCELSELLLLVISVAGVAGRGWLRPLFELILAAAGIADV